MDTPKSFIIVLCAGILSGCGEQADVNEQELESARLDCPENGILISNPWIRTARAGQPTTAAYLEIANCSDTDDALMTAFYENAGALELHATTMDGDAMTSMTPTKTIPLPAGETVMLKPGGAHIMLIDVNAAIEEGDDPLIKLEFENAGTQSLVFDVRSAIDENSHTGH